jgi:hypothetical protein
MFKDTDPAWNDALVDDRAKIAGLNFVATKSPALSATLIPADDRKSDVTPVCMSVIVRRTRFGKEDIPGH